MQFAFLEGVRPKFGALDEKRYFVSCCFAPFVVRTLLEAVRTTTLIGMTFKWFVYKQ